MTDRLDVLLSAQMDDALTTEEARELEVLLTAHPDAVERARAFAEVDARLNTLAAESAADDNLAVIYGDLRSRLGFGESAEPMTDLKASRDDQSMAGRDDASRFELKLLGRSVVPLIFAAAAAAALLFYLVLPMGPPATEGLSVTTHVADRELDGTDEAVASSVVADTQLVTDPQLATGTELDADLEDELVLVLGYGDEMSEISGISSDDLDVIEQLDLLDFLSTRELTLDDRGERG